jgi:hypothetical protein
MEEIFEQKEDHAEDLNDLLRNEESAHELSRSTPAAAGSPIGDGTEAGLW